jgi:hypothetical protein
MNEEEKLMWDWLCGDADAWTKYAKEKDDAKKNDNEHAGVSDKFNIVNNRLELFLNKRNRNGNKRRYIFTERKN